MLDPASNLALGVAVAAAGGFVMGWLLRGRSWSPRDSRAGDARLDLVVAQERDRSLASSAKAAELGHLQRIARLEQDLGDRSAQVASLREETARLARLRHDLEARLAQSQEDLAGRTEELAAALARLETPAAGSAPGELTPVPPAAAAAGDSRLPEHLEALEARLHEALERATEAEARHAVALREERDARAQLQARLTDAESRASRLNDLEAQLEDSERRRGQAQHELEGEARRLRARNAELEGVVRQRDELERALQAREEELRHRAEQLQESSVERDRRLASEAEATTLRSILAERDRELEALRSSAPRSPGARQAPNPVPGLAAPRRRGRQSADRDDLQRIRGIGPALERRLNRLGITRYGQIARWSGEDIVRIAGELDDSAERIRRGGWVESARREHGRKYGNDPLTGAPIAEKA